MYHALTSAIAKPALPVLAAFASLLFALNAADARTGTEPTGSLSCDDALTEVGKILDERTNKNNPNAGQAPSVFIALGTAPLTNKDGTLIVKNKKPVYPIDFKDQSSGKWDKMAGALPCFTIKGRFERKTGTTKKQETDIKALPNVSLIAFFQQSGHSRTPSRVAVYDVKWENRKSDDADKIRIVAFRGNDQPVVKAGSTSNATQSLFWLPNDNSGARTAVLCQGPCVRFVEKYQELKPKGTVPTKSTKTDPCTVPVEDSTRNKPSGATHVNAPDASGSADQSTGGSSQSTKSALGKSPIDSSFKDKVNNTFVAVEKQFACNNPNYIRDFSAPLTDDNFVFEREDGKTIPDQVRGELKVQIQSREDCGDQTTNNLQDALLAMISKCLTVKLDDKWSYRRAELSAENGKVVFRIIIEPIPLRTFTSILVDAEHGDGDELPETCQLVAQINGVDTIHFSRPTGNTNAYEFESIGLSVPKEVAGQTLIITAAQSSSCKLKDGPITKQILPYLVSGDGRLIVRDVLLIPSRKDFLIYIATQLGSPGGPTGHGTEERYAMTRLGKEVRTRFLFEIIKRAMDRSRLDFQNFVLISSGEPGTPLHKRVLKTGETNSSQIGNAVMQFLKELSFPSNEFGWRRVTADLEASGYSGESFGRTLFVGPSGFDTRESFCNDNLADLPKSIADDERFILYLGGRIKDAVRPAEFDTLPALFSLRCLAPSGAQDLQRMILFPESLSSGWETDLQARMRELLR